MDPFISKHDPNAYKGKMNRLTFSQQLSRLYHHASEQIVDTIDLDGHELINLRIDAQNEAWRHIMKEIERLAEEVLATDEKTLDWFWNTTREELGGFAMKPDIKITPPASADPRPTKDVPVMTTVKTEANDAN